MTSFGWKKKTGQNVNKRKVESFEKESIDDVDKELETGTIDWITLAPKRSKFSLEDAILKAKRLENEGAILAEAERYWEAILKWDEAISLTPENEKLYDMKAQVYLILHEVYPAVQSAEKSVSLNPKWWGAYQTLGRTQLGLGEVKLALKSFSKAIHLHPIDAELWNDDLKWTISLLEKRKNIEIEKLREKDNVTDIKITDITEPGTSATEQKLLTKCEVDTNTVSTSAVDCDNVDNEEIEKIPLGYVIMRT